MPQGIVEVGSMGARLLAPTLWPMLPSVLHWAVLVLIAAGSGLIIFGFLKTSHANGGWAKHAADGIAMRAATAWRRMRGRKRVTIQAPMAWATTQVTMSGRGSVVSGPIDESLSDSEKVDELWKRFHAHELNSNASIENLYQTGDKDRTEFRAAVGNLQTQVIDVRSELLVGLRKSALDGLAFAAWGAVAVALGDVLGALLPLWGI